MNNIYRIADKNIKINSLFSFIHVYCRGYETDGEPDFEVEITDADLKAESKTVQAEVTGGWVEISAVYRKIAEIMPKYDTLMLHGSAVSEPVFTILMIAIITEFRPYLEFTVYSGFFATPQTL